jgi:hypothetical protein
VCYDATVSQVLVECGVVNRGRYIGSWPCRESQVAAAGRSGRRKAAGQGVEEVVEVNGMHKGTARALGIE